MSKAVVNLGKERVWGPSVFDKLQDGADARAKNIEAVREAALARRLSPMAPDVQAVDDPVLSTTPDTAYSGGPFQDRPRNRSEEPDMSRRELDRVDGFFGWIPPRLRRSLMALVTAAGIGTLVAACGGGGNNGEVKGTATGTPFGTPANTGGSGESPKPSGTLVPPSFATPNPESPTATPHEPTATATATEAPTATQTVAPTAEPTEEPTPAFEIPKVDPKVHINQVIADVENVDGSLINPGTWEVQKSAILDGESPDERGFPGLLDVKVALDAGDWTLAYQMMVNPNLFRNLSVPLFTPTKEDEPSITFETNPENEIFKYDPQKKFIGSRTSLPANRLGPIKDFLILYYNIPQ